MTGISNKENQFIEDMLEILTALGKVTVLTKPKYFALHKDDILFGKIEEMQVFLLDEKEQFEKIDAGTIDKIIKRSIDRQALDYFILKATKSCWAAKERAKIISQHNALLEEIS